MTGDGAAAEHLAELEDAELVVRVDDGVPGGASAMRRCATWPTPACQRERRDLHVAVADRLVDDGHRSWAADHLEQAALAAMDLEPAARELPERAADALAEAGDRARRRMESRTAVDRYARALSRWAATRAAGACVKRESWRAWASRTIGSRSMPTRSMCSSAQVNLGTEHDDPWTLALAFRFLGDIAINVWADVDRAEILLDRSLVEAERLGEPHAIARTLLFAGCCGHGTGSPKPSPSGAGRSRSRNGTTIGIKVRALCSLSIAIGDLDRLDEPRR